MDFLYRLIGTPLGWVMWLCYQVVKNYGVALFLFTLIVRGAMLPLTFKQQKSTAKMSLIQPQMAELQKKYANNREKLAEEMNKLYQKEGYSPTSGCLPMLVQFPILFGLIDVIYRPLKHILRLPAEVITTIEQITFDLGLVPSIKGLNPAQIRAAQDIRVNPGNWTAIGQEMIDRINTLDLNFLGMDLGQTPSWDLFTGIFTGGGFNPLIFIPILSGVSALIMSLISMRNSAASMGDAGGSSAATMKGMMLMMPFFSFFIALSVPAGVGLYWFYSNLFGIAQSLILNKYYNPKEMAAKAKQEQEERLERERQERIEAKKNAKKKAKEAGEEYIDEAALSQKEINRRKLAAARKRDAERYGEEYVDVTDDDIK